MQLTEEHIELRRSLEKFIDHEINPHVDDWEREGRFPAHELFRKMGDLGFLGINKPEAGAPFDQVYRVVNLTDRAFATSGDYRIFFESQGRRYSHIIDPRTGYPVANDVVSASVTADTCALADGLATALMVMGAEAGVQLINRMEGVEGLIITRDDQDRLHDHASRGFQTVK